MFVSSTILIRSGLNNHGLGFSLLWCFRYLWGVSGIAANIVKPAVQMLSVRPGVQTIAFWTEDIQFLHELIDCNFLHWSVLHSCYVYFISRSRVSPAKPPQGVGQIHNWTCALSKLHCFINFKYSSICFSCIVWDSEASGSSNEEPQPRRNHQRELPRRLRPFRLFRLKYNKIFSFLFTLVKALREIDYMPKAIVMPLCIEEEDVKEELGVHTLIAFL